METVTPVRHVPPAEVSQMLARARMRRGWRLREAAARLGISAGYLSRLECGQRAPSVRMARRLAEGLRLTDAERAELYAVAVTDEDRGRGPLPVSA